MFNLVMHQGGIGTTTLSAYRIFIGNGTPSILQSSNWMKGSSNNRLGIGKTKPSSTLVISGPINSGNIMSLGVGGAINGTWVVPLVYLIVCLQLEILM